MLKKMIITFIFMVILIIAGYFTVISIILNAVVDEKKIAKELVGEEIILKKDTLEIVDYSMFESNYTLEDGRTVSFEYAKKKLIKTE